MWSRLANFRSAARIPFVRSDIDHLPPIQQGELDRVKQTLMGEFAEATEPR